MSRLILTGYLDFDIAGLVLLLVFGIYGYFELYLWFRPLSGELLFACSRKE